MRKLNLLICKNSARQFTGLQNTHWPDTTIVKQIGISILFDVNTFPKQSQIPRAITILLGTLLIKDENFIQQTQSFAEK